MKDSSQELSQTREINGEEREVPGENRVLGKRKLSALQVRDKHKRKLTR